MKEFYTIPSKPYFKVSRDGQIMNARTGNIISQFSDKDGYKRVAAWVDGKTKHCGVHRAVAEVFVNNPDPVNLTLVNHKNGIKWNNSIDNLEWVSASLNAQHGYQQNKMSYAGEKHSQARLTEDQVREICRLFISGLRICDIFPMFNVSRHIIMNIRNGVSWTHITVPEFPELNVVSRKSSFSKSTAEWVKFNLDKGTSKAEILKQAKDLSEEKLDKIISYINENVTTIENTEKSGS